jgi:hypothetical protein
MQSSKRGSSFDLATRKSKKESLVSQEKPFGTILKFKVNLLARVWEESAAKPKLELSASRLANL